MYGVPEYAVFVRDADTNAYRCGIYLVCKHVSVVFNFTPVCVMYITDKFFKDRVCKEVHKTLHAKTS